MQLSYEELSPHHLQACADIAATAPDPWSIETLRRVMQAPNRWCVLALVNGRPAGFACFLLVEDSADLELVAVHPGLRRQGVALALLRHCLPGLPPKGPGRCLLEVRCQNAPAMALYQALGFKTLARRPGMFQNPPDDGFLMALRLGDTDAP